MTDIRPIRRAVLSVSDKQGLLELARALVDRGVHLLASGGTYQALLKAGLAVEEISAYTGQAEILGGRVKTLHPRIHAGILARRDHPEDLQVLSESRIEPIDLVVVNLYPFEQTIAKPDVSFEDAVENIDIGGPSLIRGAAKNHADVAVVTDPSQYPSVLQQFSDHGGTTAEFRKTLALAAFQRTASYDRAIADYLAAATTSADDPFPASLSLEFRKRSTLRYGENPHQRAALFIDPSDHGIHLGSAQVLHGKELSYNNLLDLDSALRLIRSLVQPAAVILKHNNPCGAAIAETLDAAFERAYDGDPVSAYGGIVGLNREVDAETALRMCEPKRFIEAILAPAFRPEAIEILTTKPTWRNSVRLLAVNAPLTPIPTALPSGFDLRRIEGGLLVQDWDQLASEPCRGEVPTRRAPTEAECIDLDFAWRVCQSVKSNAIVLAKAGQIVGVGAGQMSRLDSARIAVEKAGPRATGSVLASDAFFPFRDGPDTAARAGVTAIIQPGGAKRDQDTIAACDEHGLAMILTGRRHFRH